MTLADPTPEQLALVQDEAVRITRELIRIDSSNYGGHDPETWGPGEREAAEYVVAQLEEVGLKPQILESAPGRANVVVRLEGEDRERGGLVLHGHLDVVPAAAEDWSVDPFAAEVIDGMLYGRGAVDMKDMDGMILAVVRHLARTGQKPPRDLVIVMFADEEAGGTYGSRWMIEHHPEIFEGCTEAISEVGGYSITLPRKDTSEDVRAYLLQTAEKGYAWLKLRATGRAGHGSVPNDENAIVRLSQAVAAIDAHEFPREYVASVRTLFDRVSEITGTPWQEDDAESFLPLLGGARQFVAGTLADSANVTTFHAGYKGNVIPQVAEAELDCRFLPGHQDDLLQLIDELSGEHVEVIIDKIGVSLDAPHETAFVEAMHRSILAEDPGAELIPYCLSAGTDNKQLSQIGIDGYGFAPLQLPADLDFAPLFHGIDERVPVDAIRFGARVLLRLVGDC
ncbi:M20/M25/M40 family metallo-hydrolase [Brachybacterium sp. J144]|uniref:M20/M25/M40 family metallo-hydrolase n=1 Tax=Brachybacterium sp. J144 TaxID=3116487 RepID=UPI002E778ECF|nr:M20/M25/M40 family metallo-hydrolase [Brachybacterium sp. J144]MEE1650714.1 M20/M25/M40 family metallo-hydrolase [Brachybacterium sp. J144]